MFTMRPAERKSEPKERLPFRERLIRFLFGLTQDERRRLAGALRDNPFINLEWARLRRSRRAWGELAVWFSLALIVAVPLCLWILSPDSLSTTAKGWIGHGLFLAAFLAPVLGWFPMVVSGGVAGRGVAPQLQVTPLTAVDAVVGLFVGRSMWMLIFVGALWIPALGCALLRTINDFNMLHLGIAVGCIIVPPGHLVVCIWFGMDSLGMSFLPHRERIRNLAWNTGGIILGLSMILLPYQGLLLSLPQPEPFLMIWLTCVILVFAEYTLRRTLRGLMLHVRDYKGLSE